MKTQQTTSKLSSITSTATIAFSILVSALLFVGQASAADVFSSGITDSVQESTATDNNVLPDTASILVNINEAGASALSEALKGIGLKKAQAIVEWRNKNGNFAELEQLLEVKGIGEKTLLTNRHKMTL